MVSPRFLRALIALSPVIGAVSGAATPFDSLEFRRNQHGWPQAVAPDVHNSSWPDFAAATLRWSSYDAPTFDLVFLPKTEQELSIGLRYLTSNKIPFLTKSGGHGYSITLQSIQKGVLINMENFNKATVNADKTATIGSGVTFDGMVQAIAAAGRELTVGSCPCVGATGAMLGGGVGRLQGLHGLTSDAVRKVRLALYNGTIIEASNSVNKELFWGVRGAGQNFGIIIETTFETYPLTNGGINYQADLTFNVSSVRTLASTINSLLPLDPALAFILLGATDPTTLETIVFLNLVYAGPQDKAKKYTAKFTSFSTSLNESLISWKDLPTQQAGGAIGAECAKGKRQDMYGAVTKTLDPASFESLFADYGAFIKANPAANASAFLVETFGQQAVNALPDDYDAFPHRGQLNNFIEFDAQYVDDSVAAAGDKWAKKWRDHFAQPSIGGYDPPVVYQNYAHGDEPLSELYGFSKARHQRLTNLKNAYDPHGFFDAYHAIPRDIRKWT